MSTKTLLLVFLVVVLAAKLTFSLPMSIIDSKTSNNIVSEGHEVRNFVDDSTCNWHCQRLRNCAALQFIIQTLNCNPAPAGCSC